MLFLTTTGTVSPTVRFMGNILDNVKHYNYLGVISDHTMSCDLFLKEKYNKANMRIYWVDCTNI